MASAKKGKKSKGKTVPLQDFLLDTPGAVPSMPIRKSSTLNWADEVEDNHDSYESRPKANVVLPTAPKASRDFDDIIDKVPMDPPFIAYLSNLPYDVDEEEITYFFKNMKIANMRIPKDERSGEMPKLKGFGYVEFEDRDSLLNALVIPDTTIKNRRIRIEIASDNDNDRRRPGGRMDMNRDRGRSDISSGDWRSGPRQESSDNDRRDDRRDDRRGGFGSRDREREGESNTSGAWREGGRTNREPERSFSRPSDNFRRGGDQEFTRSRDNNRDQEFTRSRDNRDQDFNRGRNDRDDRFMSRRFDGERGGGGGGGGGYSDRGGGGGGGGGYTERGGAGGGSFTRNSAPREESEPRRDETGQRRKLNLAPRSKPVEGDSDKVASSTSIFGNAKPVDTAAKERQIEERLAKDHDPSPRREMNRDSRDNYDKENLGHKDKKDKEKVPEDEIESSDVNGVVEQGDPPKRNEEHKDDVEEDTAENTKPERKREEKKDKVEKEMPKLKKTDPPNFIASNKFAFLETEDNSD